VAGIESFLPPSVAPTVAPTTVPIASEPVVRAVMFWTSDCSACRKVVADTLPPLRERYGSQLDIQLIDIITAEDVDRLYRVAAFGVSKDDVDLPLLIIGNQVLVGSEQIPAELPGVIEQYLAVGGVDFPNIPDPVVDDSLSRAPTAESTVIRPDGLELAIGIMAGMVAALGYVAVRVTRAPRRRLRPLPEWANILFVALIVAELGVAGYLAYVETQAVAAVCGPVGDCNAVQSSPYAKLFGVLPIGVLGMFGYVAILAAWLWGRFRTDRLAEYAPLAVFGMSVFGVLFSLYLTYLEPFVIKAVCAWCLSSAVIMTALMLLSLRPALQAMATNRYKEA